MCEIIIVNQTKEVETIADFEDVFGMLPVSPYTVDDKDQCLCHCDIEETFNVLKVDYEKSDGGDFLVNDFKSEPMKKVKNLRVTVSYTVELGNIEVTDKQHNELTKVYEDDELIKEDSFVYSNGKRYSIDNARFFIEHNINECDCIEWTARVEDISN